MNKSWWANVASTILSVVQTVAILVGLYISFHAFKASTKASSAETMLKYSELLDRVSGHDGKMMVVIYHDQPLLKDKGGKFTTDDLDELLGDFQLLDEAYSEDVIDDDMLCDSFSDDVTKVLHNEEVGAYLAKVRREDNTFYTGLEDMQDACDDHTKK